VILVATGAWTICWTNEWKYGSGCNELCEENELDGTRIDRGQANYQVDFRLDSRGANKD